MRETVMGYNAYHPPVEELDLTTGTLSMDRESRWTVSLHNMEFIFQCKLKLFSKSISQNIFMDIGADIQNSILGI